jgi:hypothetical protein
MFIFYAIIDNKRIMVISIMNNIIVLTIIEKIDEINAIDNLTLLTILGTIIGILIAVYRFYMHFYKKKEKIREQIIEDNLIPVNKYYDQINVNQPDFGKFINYCDQLKIFQSNINNFNINILKCQQVKMYYDKKNELIKYFSNQKLNSSQRISLSMVNKKD